MVICLGKSTYARCGIIVNVTPLEPGWEGYVTLEFSNTTLYQQKFMQMREQPNLFLLKVMKDPKFHIQKEKGKYMKQKGVTLPKI